MKKLNRCYNVELREASSEPVRVVHDLNTEDLVVVSFAEDGAIVPCTFEILNPRTILVVPDASVDLISVMVYEDREFQESLVDSPVSKPLVFPA